MTNGLITKIAFHLVCGIAFIGTSSCSILKMNAIATYTKNIKTAPFDVVIVPGLPYDAAGINPLLKARILWAKELYDKGITRHIIFSGSAVRSPYVEAVVMKMMADTLGIPTHHTFIEDQALHSTENVSYGIQLAHRLGFEKIALATDPIQALILKKFTRDNHSHVCLLPFDFNSMRFYYETRVPNLNVEKAFVENFVSLKNGESKNATIQD